MQNFNNLYIIGTSHISKQSIKEIKTAFIELKPELVAVELDRHRVQALLQEKRGKPSIFDIKHIGFKGYLFALLGSWIGKKLGKIVGVQPGTEMKTAVLLAKKNKVKVALIDQHIQITLSRFSKAFSWNERWHFLVDIFKGLILRKKDPMLNFDLSKVPDKKLIKMMIARVKERYPNVHKVLIEERNYFMARKLKKLIAAYPAKKILAVVGAGHEEEILRILKENEAVTFTVSNDPSISISY